MKLQELFTELAAHMGLPAPASTMEETYQLVFDDTVVVDLEPDTINEGVLILHTVLGFAPPDGKSAFYTLLLQGNYLGHETHGSVLAISPESGEVVLSRRLSGAELAVEPLARALEQLVSTAKDWAEKIAASPAPRTTTQEPVFAGMIRV